MLLQLDKTPENIVDRIKSKVYRTIRDYRRSQLRKKVAYSKPCPPADTRENLSVHMLLCKRDFLMGICAAKSFNLSCWKSFPFTFHEDGSLSDKDADLLSFHFPGSRIIRRKEADIELDENYNNLTKTLNWRKGFPLALKTIDVVHFCSTERILFIDPDILFFKKPYFLLEKISDSKNYFNRDIETAYFTSVQTAKEVFGVTLKESINSGLWILNKRALDLNKLEDFLQNKRFPELEKTRKHVAEQTLLAMLSCSSEYETLYFPKEYDVAYFKNVEGSICKHYVGRVRHGFELEGLRYLLQDLHFEKRWELFSSKK